MKQTTTQRALRAASLLLLLATGATAQEHAMRIYDLRDLVGADAPAPQLGEDAKDLERSSDEALIDLLRSQFDPELGEHEDLTLREGFLAARLRPSQHAWLLAFLDRQRAGEQTVSIDVELIRGKTETLAELGLSPGDCVVLDEKGDTALRGAVKTSRLTLHTAPHLDLHPMRLGHISIINRARYVKRWNAVQVEAPSEVELLVPEIATLQEGTVIEARGMLLGGDALAAHFSLRDLHIRRPIPTHTQEVSGREREYAKPKWDEIEASSAVAVVGSGTVVMVTPAERGEAAAVVVRLQIGGRAR